MSNTPEWFQLTADEQKPVSPARKPFRKSIKFSLIAAPLLLIGVFGAVAVGAHEDFDNEAPMVSKSNAVVSTVANSDNAKVNKVNIASNQTNGNSITSALENSGAPGTSGTSGKANGIPAPSAQIEHEEDDDEHEGRERHHEGRDH